MPRESQHRLPDRVGPYRILRELGRGSHAVVFLGERARGEQDGARDSVTRPQPVAIKVLLWARDPKLVERFRREAVVASRVADRGIVGVKEVGAYNGHPYIAMEYCPGETLEQRLARKGRLEPRDAARLVRDMARTMEKAHLKGVIHRDLKPANVILHGPARQPRITDFGLARDDQLTSMTRTRDFIGTPHYMAPEQFSNPKGVDARADVYGLGAMLYQCVAGRTPYEGQTVAELVQAVRKGPPPKPRRVVPELPARLERVILKAMARDPHQRYQGAGELAEALHQFLVDDEQGEPGSGGLLLLAGGAAAAMLLLSVAIGLALLGPGGDVDVEERAALPSPPAQSPAPGDLQTRGSDPFALDPLSGPNAPAPSPSPEPWVRAGASSGSVVEPDPRPLPPQRASSEDRRRANQLVEEANQLLGRQRADDALRKLGQALELDPDCAEALRLRVHLNRMTRRPDPAIEDLERLIALEPRRADNHHWLGYCYWMKNQPAVAVQHHTRALELDPDYALATFNRGVCLTMAGELERAVADFERSIELDRKEYFFKATEQITHLRLRQGRVDEALAVVTRAVAEEGDSGTVALRLRALCYARARRLQEAERDLDRAAEIEPREARVYELRAQVREAQQRPEEALADYQRAGELNPKLLKAFLGKSRILEALQRPQEASQALFDALMLVPERHPERAKIEAKIEQLTRQAEEQKSP